MPYKNPDQKRAYMKAYMARRRAFVRPSTSPEPEPVRPNQERTQKPPRFLDRDRPYTTEDRYPYPAYLVQDGYWYDPKTGEVVGKAR